MPSVLITGCNGLIGHKLVRLLADRPAVQVYATSRGACRIPTRSGFEYYPADVEDAAQVRALIAALKPQVVVHCAALSLADACQADPQACHSANVLATQHLLEACAPLKSHFVLLSTDFVFDGTAGPYRETDTPNPLSVYGQSKWQAEQLVHAYPGPWAVARTQLVYGYVPGMSRSNLVLWVRRELQNGRAIQVVADQHRMPTLADDLADALAAVVFRRAQGTFHISGREMYTVHEVALRTAQVYELDASLITPVPSDQLNERAPRPPRTGFILLKAQTELGYNPHGLEEGLRQVERHLLA